MRTTRSRGFRVALVAVAASAAVAATVIATTSAPAATVAPNATAATTPTTNNAAVFGIHDSAMNDCDGSQSATTVDQRHLGMAASSFNDGLFTGLKVKNARVIVPWDIAWPHRVNGEKQLQVVQACFNSWLQAAAAHGVTPEVVFQPDFNDPHNKKFVDPKTHQTMSEDWNPSVSAYVQAMDAFQATYVNCLINCGNRAAVTTVAPWNEPDDQATAGNQIFDQVAPAQAAEYWVAVYHRCPGCTVIAGDFTNAYGLNPYQKGHSYLYDYKLALYHRGVSRQAKVWAVHPYNDVRRYELCELGVDPNTNCVVRDPAHTKLADFAAALQRVGYHEETHIWIDEITVDRQIDNHPLDAGQQRKAAQYMLDTLYKSGGRTTNGQPFVTRLYYLRYADKDTSTATQSPLVFLSKKNGTFYDGNGNIADGKQGHVYPVFSARGGVWQ